MDVADPHLDPHAALRVLEREEFGAIALGEVSRRRLARRGTRQRRCIGSRAASCRVVHHDRRAHRNDDQRHCRRHDHHPGKCLAPIPAVVRHGSTSSGTGPVHRVDGELVPGAGSARRSGVVGFGSGFVLHLGLVLKLVIVLDADEGNRSNLVVVVG